MMDIYGIGRALRAVNEVYFRSARRAGRTTFMIDMLSDGDRVLCGSVEAARHIEHQARKRGKKIETIVYSSIAQTIDKLVGSAHQGKNLADHTFIERYYIEEMETAEKNLASFQAVIQKFESPSSISRMGDPRWE